MKTITNIIKTILLLTIFSSSLAGVDEVDSLQYDDENHVSIVSPTDPELKWQKYLTCVISKQLTLQQSVTQSLK